MKLRLSRGDKVFLIIFFAVYIPVAILQAKSVTLPEGIGQRWIVDLIPQWGLLGRVNPMTIFMTWMVIVIIILLFAPVFRGFKPVPDRRQAFLEYILNYLYTSTKDMISDERFARPVFMIAATLFMFVVVSNLIGSVPGIQVTPTSEGLKISLFMDTWYSPTSDLNTNATYAVMVLILSHVFGIKAKGFKRWLKAWIEPTPLMLPLNIIGEIAKPISHSLRLFGNIMGGGILVLIISYLTKYFLMPVFLWGFFGIFVGIIQAMVFSLLAIAYIGTQIEEG
ncbi:MAG: F-type H+-transporting ATPase subunit a [Thermotogota bacterium]|nr:F-type H+-transporting ATPase subunit a [Thermotogota bacterium]